MILDEIQVLPGIKNKPHNYYLKKKKNPSVFYPPQKIKKLNPP